MHSLTNHPFLTFMFILLLLLYLHVSKDSTLTIALTQKKIDRFFIKNKKNVFLDIRTTERFKRYHILDSVCFNLARNQQGDFFENLINTRKDIIIVFDSVIELNEFLFEHQNLSKSNRLYSLNILDYKITGHYLSGD